MNLISISDSLAARRPSQPRTSAKPTPTFSSRNASHNAPLSFEPVPFVPVAHFYAHEQVCDLRVSVPIIELGDIARTEHLTEMQEASGLLGNLHGQQCLTLGP